MEHGRWTLDEVMMAIRGSFGIVSMVAHRLGDCSWHTARRYINRWEETRAAYADECERALDMSESQMLKAIQAGDGRMIRFHLMTKGKARGFSERHEVTGAEGGAVRVIFDETAEWRGGSTLPGAEDAPGSEDSL